jgi:hypothetical protein
MGIMVQVAAKYSLAVFRIFHRVQDMGMPEFIHLFAYDDVFQVFRMFHQHGQIVPVRALDALGVLARPAFSQFGIHHPELDRLKIESVYRGDHFFNGSVRQFRLHCFLLVSL